MHKDVYVGNKKGFLLLEALISLSIFLIMISLSYQLIFLRSRENLLIDYQQKIESSMEGLARE